MNTFHISKVILINDFVAAGYGLLTLNHSTECITLQVIIYHINEYIFINQYEIYIFVFQ
jgi:glucokinase